MCAATCRWPAATASRSRRRGWTSSSSSALAVIRYVARRSLLVVPVLLGVSIAVFLMLRLIPGDVVDVILGSEGSASPERLAQLRHVFGLDQPLPQQYLAWIVSLLSGDFGSSIRTSRPILP